MSKNTNMLPNELGVPSKIKVPRNAQRTPIINFAFIFSLKINTPIINKNGIVNCSTNTAIDELSPNLRAEYMVPR